MEDFDVVGVGLGPFNLSLAVLIEPLNEFRVRFFEAQPEFRWHPGLMFPGAKLQVSFLKDLVTLVDPTSAYSFLNFLVAERRLYRFLIAHSDTCSRQEFEQYYQWAASQLKSVRWEHRVQRVDLTSDLLEVQCAEGEPVTTRNLVIGSGRVPLLPRCAEPLRGASVLHSSELCTVRPALADRDAVVVGAGQSGAEVVNHVLSGELGLPRSLTWISGRMGFLPLDDSPFTNEWFHPQYVQHFYGLSAERRQALLREQRMASNGVSASLLREIYQRLYDLDILQPGRLTHRLLACHRMVDLTRDHDALVATVHDEDTGTTERLAADVVVCCTGYGIRFPDYLEPLGGRLLDGTGAPRIRHDYSLEWDGPADVRIYLQDGAESTHGIADPNLSLASWRSARIINSIAGRTAYQIEDADSTIAWRRPHVYEPPEANIP